MAALDLDVLRTIREKIVKTFDDTMDSKTDMIRWANARLDASRKEAFTATDTSYSRAVRDTTRLIADYETLYESNDALYTNQRKMEFQVESYERLRHWRWLLFIPYYIVLGMVIFGGNAHYVVWALYATLPLRVDRLVEFAKWLGRTAHGIATG